MPNNNQLANKQARTDLKSTYTGIIMTTSDIPHNRENLDKYKALWFRNYRATTANGLRLTDEGLARVTATDITTYKIDLPDKFKLTPQILLWLDQHLECPYYLANTHVILLKEAAALELILFAGDLRKLGYAKSIAARLNPDTDTE